MHAPPLGAPSTKKHSEDAMPFAVFGPAYAFIDDRLEQFLTQGASGMVAELAGPMRLALVLYVLLYGFAILRGAIAEPFMDFAVRSLKLAVIYMLATSVAYGDWVAEPLFRTLPEALAQAISGGAAQEPGAAFDQFFARGAYLGQKIADTGSAIDIAPWLMAAAVFLIGAAAAALGFGIVMIAKIALALLIALGPIFVACALFDGTRRYFFGWLSQAVNYLVLFALIISVFQLVLSLVGDQWSAIDGHDPMVGGLLFVALCFLAAIFFLQTPAIAAGIAGGASAGIADFATAGASAFRSPAAALHSAPFTTRPPTGGGSIRPARST
ncbi:type IV secretion system protein [Phenylobacterium sp.]|uniref:type IV secretion system protein n=1 Tax=Phenylobacterium sp. TaxID=1871053 RepID=UPI0028A080B3|nr:type IV secretion system protein [Phenylobacterium sp.]